MLTFATVAKATLDVRIGDKTYTLSPLAVDDWATVERDAQYRLIDHARRACCAVHDGELVGMDDATPAERQRELARIRDGIMVGANKVALTVSFNNPETVKGLLSSDATYRDMLWHSLKQEHPAISRADVAGLLASLEDVAGFMGVAMPLMQDVMSVPEEASGSNETKNGEDDANP